MPLLEALLRHYEEKAPQGLDPALDLLTAPGPFGPIALVAAHGGDFVGIAILNRLFPADDLGHALFLKDLFVMPAARRRGVGRALDGGRGPAGPGRRLLSRRLDGRRGECRISPASMRSSGPTACMPPSIV